MPTSSPAVPELLRGLVDDAAALAAHPASLEEVVRRHGEHRRAPYAAVLGSLVLADTALPRLAETLAGASLGGPLPVTVVVSGGAGALEPAVTWATLSEHAVLHAVQLRVRESDAGDLAPNARRILTAADDLLASGTLHEDVAVRLEPPPLHGGAPPASWLEVLDAVASADLGLALRTGGADAQAPPTAEELATCIIAALDRELTFTCTGGLGSAARHRYPGTGVEQHGFLTVLAGTRAALDGAGSADVAQVLEQREPARLVEDLEGLGSARRWFRSFASSSVLGPVGALAALGLLEPAP